MSVSPRKGCPFCGSRHLQHSFIKGDFPDEWREEKFHFWTISELSKYRLDQHRFVCAPCEAHGPPATEKKEAARLWDRRSRA
jgi:hypothetical protein